VTHPLVSFVHFWPKLAQKKLLFLLYTSGVCVTTNKFAKPLGQQAASQWWRAYHVIPATHHNHQLTWLMMEEQHEQLQRRRRDSLSLSLSTCRSETPPPCLARLMIDSLETPLYNGIFSPTQLNVSLEGHTFPSTFILFVLFSKP